MKKFGKIVVFSFFLLTGILLVSLILSQKCLIVRQYTYRNPKIAAPIRAVQLTDLHNYQYGRDNQRLIAKIQKQKPDVIFMTGDMLNEDEEPHGYSSASGSGSVRDCAGVFFAGKS